MQKLTGKNDKKIRREAIVRFLRKVDLGEDYLVKKTKAIKWR